MCGRSTFRTKQNLVLKPELANESEYDARLSASGRIVVSFGAWKPLLLVLSTLSSPDTP